MQSKYLNDFFYRLYLQILIIYIKIPINIHIFKFSELAKIIFKIVM